MHFSGQVFVLPRFPLFWVEIFFLLLFWGFGGDHPPHFHITMGPVYSHFKSTQLSASRSRTGLLNLIVSLLFNRQGFWLSLRLLSSSNSGTCFEMFDTLSPQWVGQYPACNFPHSHDRAYIVLCRNDSQIPSVVGVWAVIHYPVTLYPLPLKFFSVQFSLGLLKPDKKFN